MSCPSYGFSRQGLNPKMGCVYCTELSIKVHVQDVIRFICITSCWMIPQSLLAFKLHEWAYDLYKALDVLEKIFKCMHNEFPIMLRHASSTLLLTSLNLMFPNMAHILPYYQLLQYYYYLCAHGGSVSCDLSTIRLPSFLPELSGPFPARPHILMQPTLLLFPLTGVPVAVPPCCLWGMPQIRYHFLNSLPCFGASPSGAIFLLVHLGMTPP